MKGLQLLSRVWVKFEQDRVVRNTFYNAVGFFVSFCVTFVFTPMLVRNLGLGGYGLWNVTVSVLGFMSVFEFGVALAVAKYIAQYMADKDHEGISAVATFGFIVNIGLGMILTLPFYLFSKQFAGLFEDPNLTPGQIGRAIRLASLGFLPLMLRNTSLAVPMGLQRFEVRTLLRTTHNILVPVSAVIVARLGGSIEVVVLSTVSIMWVVGLVSFGVALHMLSLIGGHFLISKTYSSKMLSFITFSGLNGVGQQIFNSVDRIVVASVLGLSQVTYYTVSMGVANKFIAFSSTLTQALMPASSSWYSTGEHKRLLKYLKRATLLLGLINLGIAGLLFVIAKPFLTWWMGAAFAAQAIVPFRVLILIFALIACTAPSAQIANGVGVPWVNTVGSLVSGVATIGLIFLFGTRWGVAGAAWANAASWVKIMAPVFVGSYVLRKTSPSYEAVEC